MNTFFLVAVLVAVAFYQGSAMVFKPTSLPGSKFSGGAAKKSAPAPVAAAPKKATGSAPIKGKPAAAPKKVKKDMTWGGRPDPTPEIEVVDAGFSAPVGKGGLAFAPWRYNQEN